MKSKLLALAFLVAMTGAASARTNWVGGVTILATTAQCTNDRHQVGDTYLGTYQPKNNATITDNSPSNFLSLTFHRGAFSIKFDALTAGTPYTAVHISGRGHHNTPTGTIAQMSTTPPTVAATTQTFVLNARITNWFNTPGCTATIRAAFVKFTPVP